MSENLQDSNVSFTVEEWCVVLECFVRVMTRAGQRGVVVGRVKAGMHEMIRTLLPKRCYSLDDLRSDDLAGTTPGSEAVEDHESVLLGDGLVKVGLAVHLVSTLSF